MNHVETTGPNAPLFLRNDYYEIDGGDHYFHLSRDRPTETEADLIAAAAYPGDTYITAMVKLKPVDGCHDSIFDDSSAEDACRICHVPEFAVASQIQQTKDFYDSLLAEYEVEWDPTITF